MIKKVFFLFFLALASTAYAQDKSILVLDASGSMWGQINGKAKITIAKEVVADLLKSWPKDKLLGLVAYGHREKGSCSDIEELITPSSVNLENFSKVLGSINPKGKTPMTDAVKFAAEKLRSTEDKATVILVSDGEETCSADPCAVARELKEKGVDFTAHVIGFDLKSAGKEATAQMKCIADNTGGRFLTADTSDELLNALKTVQASVPTVAPTAAPTSTPEVAENVKAQVYLKEGIAPYDGYVTWSIFKEDGKDKVDTFYESQLKAKLEPGKYVIEAKVNTLVESKLVEVGAEALDLKYLLNAGSFALSAFTSEGGEQLDSSLVWRLLEQDEKTTVDTSYDKVAKFIAREGSYKVDVKWGSAEVLHPLNIKAGEYLDEKIYLNAGILTLKAFASEGGEQVTSNLVWRVFNAKPSLSGEYKNITTDYVESPKFLLPEGVYRVETTWGDASVINEKIEVKKNETSNINIVLNGGVLKLSAVDESNAPVSGSLLWEIYEAKQNLSGERKKVGTEYIAEPQFYLTQGKYIAVLSRENKKIEQEFEVKAGERTELKIPVASLR